MKKSILVSVIVPVYNAEPYLARCVESLRNQTYQNIEIILINDGSTDGSEAMCWAYEIADSRIHCFYQENQGSFAAWRAGIEKSQGEYLCTVDSDDWVEPEMIEEMAKRLDFAPREIVCCNHTIDRVVGGLAAGGEARGGKAGEGLPSGKGSPPMNVTKVVQGLACGIYEGEKLESVYPVLLGSEERMITLSRSMKLVSRELIVENLKHYREGLTIGEDVNIILPALLCARRIVIMEDAFYYHYFYNAYSTTHSYFPDKYKDTRALYEVTRQIFTAKVNEGVISLTEKQIESQCAREYLVLLLNAITNEARGNKRFMSYCRNVRQICRDAENRELMSRYPLALTGRQNRLLYLILRHPNLFNICLLRIATKAFYLRRKITGS